MEIPQWIANIYYKVDKNGDGIISKPEIDNLDRAKEGIGTGYIFNDGMTLESFVTTNSSIFRGYIHMEGDPEQGRHIADNNGNLQLTDAKRNRSSDTEESIEVAQGEYCVAEPNEKYSKYLQTFGVGPCVAVTIYDTKSKKGFLAHIDTSDKANDLNSVLAKLKYQGFDFNNCEARIIGGQTNQSEETVNQIKKALDNNSISVAEMDVLGNGTRAIQLDLSTGEVTDYDETIHTREDGALSGQFSLFTTDKLRQYFPRGM